MPLAEESVRPGQATLSLLRLLAPPPLPPPRPDASARGVDPHHHLIADHRIGSLPRPEASGRGVRPGQGTPRSPRFQAPPLPRPNTSGRGVLPGQRGPAAAAAPRSWALL
ncbi:hypothetical protein MDA_GLEAN10020424 [Myotis davidii]|uniref:Uncharacterized protein n=1 Tax=Myotis davidii TaxID=225400 RepID=L5MA13_MYODS|nr:hypothetical protein MDA_GLEAN10020424 [Myotis davidii]